MNKSILITIAVLLSINAKSQFITSIGAGYEFKNKAVPVQLTAGVNIGKSEIVAGYVAFLHKEDAKLPKIIFMRSGYCIDAGAFQIVPLIGAEMLTKTVFDKGVYEEDLVITPQSFNVLYGIKIQKQIGLGGLFASGETCGKMTYLNAGMFVKIN